MSTHALEGGLRPALPPTLQPMALALAAPRTDKRVALLGSAAAYVLLPAALLALGKMAPIRVPAPTTSPETVVLLDPPTATGPIAAPAAPSIPQSPIGPAPNAMAEARPVDATEATTSLSELLTQGPQVPSTAGPGTSGTGTPDGSRIPGVLPSTGTGLPTGTVVQVSAESVRILHQEVPVYPAVARAVRQQGDVVVRMVIDPFGIPTSVTVEQGPPLLRTAAEQAARQWRFSPALVNGQAVSASFLLTLKFRLQ